MTDASRQQALDRLPPDIQSQLLNFNPNNNTEREVEAFASLYRSIELHPDRTLPSEGYFEPTDLGVVDFIIEQRALLRTRPPRDRSRALKAIDDAEAPIDKRRYNQVVALKHTAWNLRPYKIYVDFGQDAFKSYGYLKGLRDLADRTTYETAREALHAARKSRMEGTAAGVDRKVQCVNSDIEVAMKELEKQGLLRDEHQTSKLKRKRASPIPTPLSAVKEQDAESSDCEVEQGRGLKIPCLQGSPGEDRLSLVDHDFVVTDLQAGQSSPILHHATDLRNNFTRKDSHYDPFEADGHSTTCAFDNYCSADDVSEISSVDAFISGDA